MVGMMYQNPNGGAPVAHAKVESVGPAISGTNKSRMAIIVPIGILLFVVAVVVSIHRGFSIGSISVVPAAGESMSPLSHDGDTLLAINNQPLQAEMTYVFRSGEDVYHKKLANEDGRLWFVSLNDEHGGYSFIVEPQKVIGRVVFVLPTHYLGWGEEDVEKSPNIRGPSTGQRNFAEAELDLAKKKEANKVERIEKRSQQLDLLHSKLVAKISTGAKPVFDGISETGLTLDQGKCWLCEVVFSKPTTIQMLKVETDGKINFVHILTKGMWQEVTPNDPDQKYLLVGTPIEGFKVSIGPPLGDTELRISEIRCYH